MRRRAEACGNEELAGWEVLAGLGLRAGTRAAGQKRCRDPGSGRDLDPESGGAGSGSRQAPRAAASGFAAGRSGECWLWVECGPLTWETSPPDTDAAAPTLPPHVDGTPGRWF